MPLEGPVVTNTGPLIALAGIGRLDILPALFREVLAPAAVVSELLADNDQPSPPTCSNPLLGSPRSPSPTL